MLCFTVSLFASELSAKNKDLGNVWVIGDSWSACHGDHTWRRSLYQTLKKHKYTMDFIGTSSDDDPACEKGQTFDRDHNAYGGITAVGLLDQLPEWYEQLPQADNVLLMAGGNDLASHDMEQVLVTLSKMIESLRSDNSKVTIYLGGYSYTLGAEKSFVDEMHQLMFDFATDISTKKSPVYFADLRENFNPNIHELEDEHPNAAGTVVLAQNWFKTIQSITNGQGQPPLKNMENEGHYETKNEDSEEEYGGNEEDKDDEN